MSATTGPNATTTAAARVVAAFNRHGSFTARTTEMGLAVELRNVDDGALITVIWLPDAEIDRYVWTVGRDQLAAPADTSTRDLALSVAQSTGANA